MAAYRQCRSCVMREIVSVTVSISAWCVMYEGAAVIIGGDENPDWLLERHAPVLSTAAVVMHSVGEDWARANQKCCH